MDEAIRELVDSMPDHLREQHRNLVGFLRDVAARGEPLTILADKDADGMSAHALAEIARHLDVEHVSVQHVDRDQVSLEEPGAYVVYDITVTPEHEKGRNQEARVADVDHHQPRAWPKIDVISNPFYGKETAPREYYAYNPSVQLVSIADLAGYDPKGVALFSAIGAWATAPTGT